MIIFAELIVGLSWLFGANGFLLERQMETTPLGVDWVRPVAANARIIFHDQPDWAMAFYVPASAVSVAISRQDVADEILPLGDVGRPRVFLYAPYYLKAAGLREASGMSVDVAEYYFHALLEARLDLVESHGGSPYGRFVVGRAAEWMTDVPEAQRTSTYLDAVADFGAHVLSLVQEISRASQRSARSGDKPAGSELCHLLAHPASLFALWRKSLTQGAFVGWFEANESSSEGTAGPAGSQWVVSRQPLTWRDKEMFLREVLGQVWSGDPAHDFTWLCPPETLPAH